MEVVIPYLISVLLLLFAAFVVFRIIVRRDYRERGRLRPFTGFLELLVWLVFVSVPSIYNPPDWWSPWTAEVPVSTVVGIVGLALTTAGIVVVAVAMAGLGMSKTFGQKSEGLLQVGLYRACRNPQIVGGALMVVGVGLLWPSWFALGWGVLYGCIGHMMVMTEEEHLRRVHDEAYAAYCERVPRYVGFLSRTRKAVA